MAAAREEAKEVHWAALGAARILEEFGMVCSWHSLCHPWLSYMLSFNVSLILMAKVMFSLVRDLLRRTQAASKNG